VCRRREEIPGEHQQILGAGDFVGVIPCMAARSQIETVIALTDVSAISVRRDQYPELIERNIPVAMKIIRTFTKQLRLMNETLTKLTLNNVLTDTPEQLFGIAAYYEKVGKPDISVYGYYQYLKACRNGKNFAKARQRFVALKPVTHAVYLEPTKDSLRWYPKDTMIFSECQLGTDMFIIQEGKVKITKVVDGNEVTLAVLKKGDIFGEMALLENKPRSASAIAHEDCRVMVVNSENFNQMVTTQAQLVARLTTMFAERLWALYRQIMNSQLENPIHKMIDMLALELEKQRIQTDTDASYQTDLTIADIENMCGIPQNMQGQYIYKFMENSNIKIVDKKIYVKDCLELYKEAAFYRKRKA
jgi:CRP-like cAMP-binding protein